MHSFGRNICMEEILPDLDVDVRMTLHHSVRHGTKYKELSQYSDQTTGWTSGVRFPVEAGIFFLRHSVQTGSDAHPASYPMGTRGYFSGGKVTGALS
jgi:hypothetical protein